MLESIILNYSSNNKYRREISGDKISSSAAIKSELILRVLSDSPHAAPL